MIDTKSMYIYRYDQNIVIIPKIIFIFSVNRDNLVMVNVFFPENSILKYKRDELYAFEDIICKFY